MYSLCETVLSINTAIVLSEQPLLGLDFWIKFKKRITLWVAVELRCPSSHHPVCQSSIGICFSSLATFNTGPSMKILNVWTLDCIVYIRVCVHDIWLTPTVLESLWRWMKTVGPIPSLPNGLIELCCESLHKSLKFLVLLIFLFLELQSLYTVRSKLLV